MCGMDLEFGFRSWDIVAQTDRSSYQRIFSTLASPAYVCAKCKWIVKDCNKIHSKFPNEKTPLA
jgi:hypothetical protein